MVYITKTLQYTQDIIKAKQINLSIHAHTNCQVPSLVIHRQNDPSPMAPKPGTYFVSLEFNLFGISVCMQKHQL